MQKYLHSYLPKTCICNYRLHSIDEAKRISMGGTFNIDFPYCTDCKASKRDKNCANFMLYSVLLPLVEIYVPILKKRGVL